MVGAIDFFMNWRKICSAAKKEGCRDCPLLEACGYVKGTKPCLLANEDIQELVRQVDIEIRKMEGQHGENTSKERYKKS